MIITAFKPKTEAKIATAIPVFPLVGSTIIVSLLIEPCDIASSNIPSTALSLTLPPRLYFSSFTKIFVLSNLYTGVFPTNFNDVAIIKNSSF